MKKIMLLLIIGMFLISLASAEINDLGLVKQNHCILIRQSCASCSYVNISISYPNQTLAIKNVAMDYQGGGLWTYNFCNTSQLGRYDIVGSGDLEGTDTSFDVLYFNVTSTGNGGLIKWLIIIFSFAFLFLFLSIMTNEEIFVYISGVSFLLAGIMIMIYGIDILNDWTTRAIAYISIGLGFLFTLGAYIYNLFYEGGANE